MVNNTVTLSSFTHSCVAALASGGKLRTAETYTAAELSFRRFNSGKDIRLTNINSDIINRYQRYLLGRGLTPNTVSFYMRVLRAICNKAVRKNLMAPGEPFADVYTGVARTVKRAVSRRILRLVASANLEAHGRLGFARDMFMLAFYLRGIAFVDLANLKRSDLTGNLLTYSRRKTGQALCVRCEPAAMRIMERYAAPAGSPYLLDIISNPEGNVRRQYLSVQAAVNKSLRELSRRLSICPLTYYVARHSWASIARECSVPLSLISEGLGHDSVKTTRIYLASVRDSAVDRVNSRIVRLIDKG